MKELPRVPGTKILCPEDCRYRNKRAPFCGYCLPEVLKKIKLETDRRKLEMLSKKTESDSAAQTDTSINIGDWEDLWELTNDSQEKIIFHIEILEEANGDEQDNGQPK